MVSHIKKDFVLLFCVVTAICFLVSFIYSNREEYKTEFDIFYWKDRFEHSQWVLPLSRRAIGDDALFSYLGYRLVLGDDPTKINAETLPVGKYLIGISIFYLGNPAYYALFTGLFTLLVFFGLAAKIFNSIKIAAMLTTLLLLEPLFFTQLSKAWIDLLQLLLILSHLFLLVSIKKKLSFENYILAFVCGISFGLFTETKLPILLPIIAGVDAFIMWRQRINWRIISLIALGFGLAVFASYTRFFLLGNSVTDFITVQKYILSFYLSSQLSAHLTSVWQTLITGHYSTIHGNASETIQEWTLLWPLLFIGTFVVGYFVRIKENVYIMSILLYVFYALIIFSLIPFYPRYLTLVIPFLYLLFGYILYFFQRSKYVNVVILCLIIYSLVNSWKFFNPTTDTVTNTFFYNMSNKFFQDVYTENIIPPSFMSQYQFHRMTSEAFRDANIETMEFVVLEQERISPNVEQLLVEVEYKTRSLGAFSEQKNIVLSKEHSKWKVVWNWDLVINDFQPSYSFTTIINPGRRGTIKDSENNILVQDASGYLFQVNISKMDWSRENEMLEALSRYSFQIPVRLQNAYLENPIPGLPTDIATNFVGLETQDIALLKSFPGITLLPFPVREYTTVDPKSITNSFYDECCTRIYTSHNYEGVNSPEKQYNNKLIGSDGGSIVLLNENGGVIRLVHSAKAVNGTDVILEN